MTSSDFRRTILEDPMESTIKDLVAHLGGLVYHVRNASRSPELVDLPDDLLILPNRGMVVFAELKSQTRAVTPGQQLVIGMLSQCQDAHTFIVRPEPENPDEISYDDFMNWLGGAT